MTTKHTEREELIRVLREEADKNALCGGSALLTVAALKAAALLAEDDGEAVVRYCYECGTIGEVAEGKRDCCPDGSHSKRIHPEIAKQAQAGFYPSMSTRPQPAQVPLTEGRKDYLRRLVAGVRRQIDQDPETIKAREECGEECVIGTWIDASLLCLVVEKDVLHMPAYSIGKDKVS